MSLELPSRSIRLLCKGIWIVAAVAAVLLAILSTIMTRLVLLHELRPAARTYTGQVYDRDLAWLVLALSAVVTVIAVAVVDVPIRLLKLCARAHNRGVGLRRWLGSQPIRSVMAQLLTSITPLTFTVSLVLVLYSVSGVQRPWLSPPWIAVGVTLGGAGLGVLAALAGALLLRRGTSISIGGGSEANRR